MCHNLLGFPESCKFSPKKLSISRLDKNAVYSINERIPEDDTIFYCNFFGKLSNLLPCKVAVTTS